MPPAQAHLEGFGLGGQGAGEADGGGQHGGERGGGRGGFAILGFGAAAQGQFVLLIRQGRLAAGRQQADDIARTNAVFVEFFIFAPGRAEQVADDHVMELVAQLEVGGQQVRHRAAPI